jgi:glycosyltransferase involved in cell wall biosynthesis
MIKILHLRSSGGLLGAESVIIELCKHAEENNYKAVIGAINNIDDPYPEFLDVAKALSIETIVFSCKSQFDFNCARTINKYVCKNGIDILHTHGYKEDFYAILSNVSIPKIATNHLWKKNNLKDKIYCFMDSFFLRRFDKVIGVSEEIVQELKSKNIKNAIKIANGIDVKKYSTIKKTDPCHNRFGIPESHVIIGMISSITPEKGHKIALKAFAAALQQYKNASLLIVGDGPELPVIKKLASVLQIDNNIIFTEKRTDIPEILSIIDVFLVTSLTEGLPMALLEAMAAGKAVISTNVGEIPYVIQDKINGILIKPDDIEGTARTLQTIFSAGKDIQRKLGANAYATINGSYSSEAMAKKYFTLYNSVI